MSSRTGIHASASLSARFESASASATAFSARFVLYVPDSAISARQSFVAARSSAPGSFPSAALSTALRCSSSRTAGSLSVALVKFLFAFGSSGAALSAICAALAASSRSPFSNSSFATTSAARAPWVRERRSGRSTRSAFVASPAR